MCNLIKAAEQVYNSYLLFYKLSALRVSTGKSLQEVLSDAIQNKEQHVEFEVCGQHYKVEITSDGQLKVLGEYAKPKVKDILEYADNDIIDLLANSEVFLVNGQNNNWAFTIQIDDEVRKKKLQIGGPGKRIPFSIRFANFYRVIKLLEDESIPLQEKLRLANNIATGSGKTYDIALLKLLAYLADVPCITVVPNDTLKEQSHNFYKEFLPDTVVDIFVKPLYKKAIFILDDFFSRKEPVSKDVFKRECIDDTAEYRYIHSNRSYPTITFDEAFNTYWNTLRSMENLALICIDEAPLLKQNPILMARAIEISCDKPIALFSATPDKLLNEEFRIKEQVLLSPKERAELGIGKLPVVHYHKTKFRGTSEMAAARSRYDLLFCVPERAYIDKLERTHIKLDNWKSAVEQFKQERKLNKKTLDELFIECVSKSLDSQAYKVNLIASKDTRTGNIVDSVLDNRKSQERKEKRTRSFTDAIKTLGLDLQDNEIESLIDKNLNTEVGNNLLSSIKLHIIIDSLNEYTKSNAEVTEEKLKEFIEHRYGIVNSFSFKLNTELASAIFRLSQIGSKYKASISRNYPGDKELHNYIFQEYPQIKEFCEQNTVISNFDKEITIHKFRSSESCSDIGCNHQNMLNFIKAGFVPSVISKDLAIGIDALRLDSAAALAKGTSSILHPMFLIQLIGRIGRDVNRKGKCFFDLFTTDSSYFEVQDITQLSGEELCVRLEKANQKYMDDKNAIIEMRSGSLWNNIKNRYIINEAYHRLMLPSKLRDKPRFDLIQDFVKEEFKSINIQYGFNKKDCIEIFTQVLQRVSDDLNRILQMPVNARTCVIFLGLLYDDNSNQIADLKKLMQDMRNAVKSLNSKGSRIVEYSDNLSLENFAQYVMNVQPVNWDDIAGHNPDSNVPIFINKICRENGVPQIIRVAPKKTDAKKQSKYLIVASPLIAVGIYATVTLLTELKINPIIAVSIFAITSIIAVILYRYIAKDCEAQEVQSKIMDNVIDSIDLSYTVGI
ncbi:hypothetical protein [Wolbachia pipientis]|nr:hypothetical protein [Wolbachia pipientis]